MYSQAAQVHNTMTGVTLCVFFNFLYANIQRAKCDMGHILYMYYLTIELDHAKRDSRLAAYGGVVLQQFEGLNKGLYGDATVLLKKSILLIFCE